MILSKIQLLISLLLLVGEILVVVDATGEVGLMKRLKEKLDFQPRAMLDIGANSGQTSQAARTIWPDTSIFMLEASSRHTRSLNETVQKIGNAEFRIGLLSSEDDQEVDFWDGDSTTGNSMFKEQTRFFSKVEPQKQRTNTLDRVVAESQILANQTIDFIKVDVQGAELLVLSGALNTLSQVSFIQLESSTIVYNKGAPCTWEVDAFLRNQGFALYDIGELIYHKGLFKTGGVGQYEVLYINPNSPRLPRKHNRGAEFCFDSSYSTTAEAVVAAESSSSSNVQRKLGSVSFDASPLWDYDVPQFFPTNDSIPFLVFLQGFMSGILAAGTLSWISSRIRKIASSTS